jgi:hypothetical protein
MEHIQRPIRSVQNNQRAYIIGVIVVLFAAFLVGNQLTLPRQAADAIKSNVVNQYSDLFTSKNIMSVHDGSYDKHQQNPRVQLDVRYQLTGQDMQQLLSAKQLLQCDTGRQCTAHDVAPVNASAGNYAATADYNDGVTELYLDSTKNQAELIIRRN